MLDKLITRLWWHAFSLKLNIFQPKSILLLLMNVSGGYTKSWWYFFPSIPASLEGSEDQKFVFFKYIFHTFMILFDFVWLCMTMYDYVCPCMTMHDYVWLCTTIYYYIMTMYEYVWLFMTMYEYLWICLTMFDYVWLCMTIYDYVSLCITMYH